MIKKYNTHDEVPDAFKESAFEDKEGKWVTDEPDPAVQEQISKLELALENERTHGKNDAKKLKDMEKELRLLKQGKKAQDGGVTEDVLEQLRQEDALARKPLEEKIEELTTQNTKFKLDDTIRRDAIPLILEDRLDDAMDIILHPTKPRAKLGDKGGIIILDKEGKETTETLAKFLGETLRKEKSYLYRATTARKEVPEVTPSTTTGLTPGGEQLVKKVAGAF